jgi:hypothetical protein
MIFYNREYEYEDYIHKYNNFFKNRWKKMNLLFTGCCGYIGYYISENKHKT